MSDEIEMEYNKFLSTYGRDVAGKEEYSYRLSIFAENYKRIQAHNEQEGNSFTLAINHMADWSHSEYKQLLGYK